MSDNEKRFYAVVAWIVLGFAFALAASQFETFTEKTDLALAVYVIGSVALAVIGFIAYIVATKFGGLKVTCGVFGAIMALLILEGVASSYEFSTTLELSLLWILLSGANGVLAYFVVQLALQVLKLIQELGSSLTAWLTQRGENRRRQQTALMRVGDELAEKRIRLKSQIESERDRAQHDSDRRASILQGLASTAHFKLSNWATILFMTASFITTAFGFWSVIMDKYLHPVVQYGFPIIFSALVSFGLWVCWNYVYRHMRLAETPSDRRKSLYLSPIIVAIALVISSSFGVVGIAGDEAQRIDYLQYSDVLSVAAEFQLSARAAEQGVVNDLKFIMARFENAKRREDMTGSGCGAGKGDLYYFFEANETDVDSIIKIVDQPRNGGIIDEIVSLQAFIADPKKPFGSAKEEIGSRLSRIRGDIYSLEASSALSSLKTLDETLATVDDRLHLWQCLDKASQEHVLSHSRRQPSNRQPVMAVQF